MREQRSTPPPEDCSSFCPNVVNVAVTSQRIAHLEMSVNRLSEDVRLLLDRSNRQIGAMYIATGVASISSALFVWVLNHLPFFVGK
jgi:hypothetical protein